MIRKTIAVLAIVILGSIAAQELLATIGRIMPILIVLALVLVIGGGWFTQKRKF